MCVRVKERNRETACVCASERETVCVCTSERETACVCASERGTVCVCASERETACVCASERETACVCASERETVCVRERKRASVFLGRLKYGNKSISDNPAMCATLACFAMLNAILPCLMIVGAGHRMRSLSICFRVRLRERGNL